jgi:hypothetical protein
VAVTPAGQVALGWAGSLQVNGEVLLGEPPGACVRWHLGHDRGAGLGDLGADIPAAVGHVPNQLAWGRAVGGGLADQVGGDLAIRRSGRGYRDRGDQLAARLLGQVDLVAVKPLVFGLAAVAHVRVADADHTARERPPA